MCLFLPLPNHFIAHLYLFCELPFHILCPFCLIWKCSLYSKNSKFSLAWHICYNYFFHFCVLFIIFFCLEVFNLCSQIYQSFSLTASWFVTYSIVVTHITKKVSFFSFFLSWSGSFLLFSPELDVSFCLWIWFQASLHKASSITFRVLLPHPFPIRTNSKPLTT